MDQHEIGRALRRSRGARSKSEVARAAGMNRHQVRGIEGGLGDYTLRSVLQVADAVGAEVVVVESRAVNRNNHKTK